MYKRYINKHDKAFAAVVGIAALSVGSVTNAATFLIDDFNTATTYACSDPVTAGSADCNSDTLPPNGENIVMTALPASAPTAPTGWSRVLSATLDAGDRVTTEICSNCKTGEFDTDAASIGAGSWVYAGPALNLVGATGRVGFEYAADLDGADVTITLSDSSGGESSALWDDLANTGGASPALLTLAPDRFLIGDVNYSAIVRVEISVSGLDVVVGGLDFSIDNVTLDIVPPQIGSFKCYFGKQRPPFGADNPRLPYPVDQVQLTDQFQDRLYDVIFLHELCNYAVKNFEPTPIQPDPVLKDEHLTCYQIRPTLGSGPLPSATVEIETENFGLDTFRLGQSWELCVPAQKTVLPDGEAEGPDNDTDYLCYTAASPPVLDDVTLDDQFARKQATVTRLEQFCVPVTKNGNQPPVIDETNAPSTWQHLACYSLREFPGPELPVDVNVVDQFTGPEGVRQTVERPRQWCERAWQVRDLIIDADGTASAGSGVPGAVDVPSGAVLADFPVSGVASAGLDWFDTDGNGQWTFGAAGDDLHAEDTATCPTAIRNGVHDLRADCKVLDIDDSLIDGQSVNCDLEVDVPFTEPHLSNGGCPSSVNNIRYYDANGNGSWDDGEDIVLDANGNSVFD